MFYFSDPYENVAMCCALVFSVNFNFCFSFGFFNCIKFTHDDMYKIESFIYTCIY